MARSVRTMPRFHPPREALSNAASVVVAAAAPLARRWLGRALSRPPYDAPLAQRPDPVALLFFEDFDRDRWFRGDRLVVRSARHLWQAVRAGQKQSGFETAFRLLVTALERAGVTVVVGDRRLARENPGAPVGICGYPHIVSGWDLPNPALLGPGLFDHPTDAPHLMDDPRFGAYMVPCEWMKALFEPHWPGKVVVWPCGIDTTVWTESPKERKTVDFLIYDKVTMKRSEYERTLVRPITESLTRRGLRFETIRYREYAPSGYRQALARARCLLFLSETETQGIAYQEALSSGVPVLAWDQGAWLDKPAHLGPDPVPASSVPYFDDTCGVRFRSVDELEGALDRFLSGPSRYAPRAFIDRHLSLEASAASYLSLLRSVAGRAGGEPGGPS